MNAPTTLIDNPHFTEDAHPAATSHAPADRDAAASLAPLPQAGGVGGGPPHFTDTTATSAQGHFTVFTGCRQADFLKSLQLYGNVRLACRAACVSAQTAYRARRASRGFALAWDAALLAARDHAEQVLADRAINGVEEAVYYHGEEVARRRRFDSRLLLAHLARLDRLEEREEVAQTLVQLDACIEALGEGAAIDDVLCLRDENCYQDSVPCVPSCRVCDAQEAEAKAVEAAQLAAARQAFEDSLAKAEEEEAF